MTTEPCLWEEDDEGTWHTGCGQMWQFVDGGLEENGARYCMYCGQSICAKKYPGEERE